MREELIRLVPAGARRVLSVGCAAGATEAELVRRGLTVVGIELNAAAAAVARQRGLTVLEGDAASTPVDAALGPFDCLLYGDILEHLADPERLLRAHTPLLSPKGYVVVSVPNFRHYSVFAELFLRGRFRYQDAGIFDRTHLRITTRKSVEAWLRACDLRPVSCTYLMSQRRQRWLAAGALHLLDEFLARQVVVVGQRI